MIGLNSGVVLPYSYKDSDCLASAPGTPNTPGGRRTFRLPSPGITMKVLQMIARRAYLTRILPLALLGLGVAFYGSPVPVELSASHLQNFGSFLIFLAFLNAIVIVGSLFADDLFQALAFASLGVAWITGFAAWFFSPGVHWKWPAIAGMGILFLVNIFRSNKTDRAPLNAQLPGASKWAVGIVALAVGLKVLDGFQIHGHGDAFITYLTAPRVWFDTGDLSSYVEVSSFFLTGLWENFYHWGNVLLAGQPGEGLDAVQRFAQWVVAAVGMGGLALSLFVLLEQLQEGSEKRVSAGLLWIAVIAGISVPSVRWMASLPKHDVGVAFWAIAGLVFFLRGRVFLAFVFFGAATISKLSILMLPVVIAIAGYFYLRKQNARYVQSVLAGGAIGALPILARNLFLTGNPVFPFANGLFHSALIPESRVSSFAEASKTASLSLSSQLSYLGEALTGQPWLVLCFVPLVSFWRWPRFSGVVRFQCAVATGAFILFNLLLRPQTEIRYQAPTLALMGALGIYVAFLLLAEITRKIDSKALKIMIPAALSLLVIALSGIPVYLLPRFAKGRLELAPKALLSHTGGAPKHWIRENVPAGTPVVTFGDDEIYYLMAHNPRMAEYSNWLDPILRDPAIPNGEARLRAFAERGYGIAYIYQGQWSVKHPRYPEIWNAMGDRPDCLRFQSAEARVFDLGCLKQN